MKFVLRKSKYSKMYFVSELYTLTVLEYFDIMDFCFLLLMNILTCLKVEAIYFSLNQYSKLVLFDTC